MIPRNQFRSPEARQRARPCSNTRMACSRSPWARYRWPRQPWAMIGAAPRPASVARRSASSPWRRPSAKAPSALKVCASHARDWIRTSVLGVPDSRSAASTLHRSSSAARPKSPMAAYACPRRWDASTCKALSPSAAASARACWPAAMAPSRSPVILRVWPIWASTRPSRARSSSALARASASPNRARCRPYSPRMISAPPNSEAEIEGQHPGVAVLGQVREGLEGLLEGGHRLAERGAVVGPGAGLLAVGHGLVPHLASQGMVRQAFDLVRVFAPEATSAPRSGASASRASTIRACRRRRRSSRRLP